MDRLPLEASHRSPAALERLALRLPLAGLAAIIALVLAWNDVLPGGWRLRNLVEPDRERVERETLRHAHERLAVFAADDRAIAPGSIVFVGSSTIERFPLAELFPGKPCANRGIANASARLLAQLVERLVPPRAPAAFVVYAGSIDWRAAGRDVSATCLALEALLGALRARAHDAPILLLAPLPERTLGASDVAQLRELERVLAERTRTAAAPSAGRPKSPYDRVDFLAFERAPFTDSAGALAKDCSVDELHLNRRGYQHLADLIRQSASPVGRLLVP